MKGWIFLFSCWISSLSLFSQSLYFPPISGSNWDTVSPATLGWCTSEINPLYDFLESNHTKAFIVLKDGKVVLEKYFGTFTQDSLWYWASAGKTITAFATGIAQQEGYLSLSDSSSTYLGAGWTNCTPFQEAQITIRHQLTMTTGLDDGVPDPYCTLDTCLNYLADAGTRWAYHNAPYTKLDGVIQAATGQNLNTWINQKLKTPTGMTGLFLPSGYNNVFYSKARSMARFGLLILNHGNWDGNQIMTDTAYFNQMTTTSQALNPSYGYLWWLNGKSSFMVPGSQFVFPGWINPHAPADMIAALGKNGQILNVVPSQQLVMVRMGNSPTAGEVGIVFCDSVWLKLNQVICNSIPTQISAINKQSPEIFPNPASGMVNVIWPGEEFTASLYSMQGNLLRQFNSQPGQLIIDTSNLAPDIYFIKISNRKLQDYYRKIIIK